MFKNWSTSVLCTISLHMLQNPYSNFSVFQLNGNTCGKPAKMNILLDYAYNILSSPTNKGRMFKIWRTPPSLPLYQFTPRKNNFHKSLCFRPYKLFKGKHSNLHRPILLHPLPYLLYYCSSPLQLFRCFWTGTSFYPLTPLCRSVTDKIMKSLINNIKFINTL